MKIWYKKAASREGYHWLVFINAQIGQWVEIVLIVELKVLSCAIKGKENGANRKYSVILLPSLPSHTVYSRLFVSRITLHL